MNRLKWINFWKRIRLYFEQKQNEFYHKLTYKVGILHCMSKLEDEAVMAFEKEHLDCYRKPSAKQGHTGFTITQQWSGIGIATNITCDCCGETKDITDYDMW